MVSSLLRPKNSHARRAHRSYFDRSSHPHYPNRDSHYQDDPGEEDEQDEEEYGLEDDGEDLDRASEEDGEPNDEATPLLPIFSAAHLGPNDLSSRSSPC